MSNLPITLFSALLGFLGVIYELTLAQTFSLLFGSSVVQYSLTFGVFLCGMGVGAALYGDRRAAQPTLARLQWLLALGAPALALLVWSLGVNGWSTTARVLGLTTGFIVGVWTGGELPLLMTLSRRPLVTLAADYFGMLVACAAFPLLLLPSFGVLNTLFLAAFGNAAAYFYFKGGPWWKKIALCAWPLLLLLFESPLRSAFSERLSL